MAANPDLTVSDICKKLGIGRTTYFRYVKAGERIVTAPALPLALFTNLFSDRFSRKFVKTGQTHTTAQ